MNNKGKLYLCATPIGNLEDITLRTIKTLESVELIAAEDTRHTIKLLNHYNIKKPMLSYFEHNKTERGKELIAKMLDGISIALVSDAGTPAISDPGEELVYQCIEEGIEVIPIPGANAAINALIVSGLPTGRFSFQGFLSMNKRSRREHLQQVKDYPETLIFYEAPHKLKRTLADMLEVFGDREISICRELTKLHEEKYLCSISQAIIKYEQVIPKGEFVLVVSGAGKITASTQEAVPTKTPQELYNNYITGGMEQKDALRAAAKDLGVSKRDIYAIIKGKDKEL